MTKKKWKRILNKMMRKKRIKIQKLCQMKQIQINHLNNNQ